MTVVQQDVWQLMPSLADDEYDALKADIAARGVLVPVEYDEHGDILDGHHRVKACRELGIDDWPGITRTGMDDEAKAEHVLALNLDRRHLSREQRWELFVSLRQRGWSLRRIAGRLGIHHTTLIKQQQNSGGEYSPPELTDRVDGADGKSYPATRPAPSEPSPTPGDSKPQPEHQIGPATPSTSIYHADTNERRRVQQSITHQRSTDREATREWYTPARYVAAARRTLGAIDLDPASSPEANQTVQATHIFTANDDGLVQPWRGRVFMNPPYWGQARAFIAKLVEHHEQGDVPGAIVLLNANGTETRSFAPLWDHTLCFTDHRISYDMPGGGVSGQPNHGSVFAYLGDDPARFEQNFRQFGNVVRRWTP